MYKQGDWVRIHSVVLAPGQRAPQVPEDTARVPLEMWVKGYLTQDARIGDTVTVRTAAGRLAQGTLIEDGLSYSHSFGDNVPELRQVANMVWDRLYGGDHHA